MMDMWETLLVEGVTDVHVTEGAPILIRRNGHLERTDFSGEPILFDQWEEGYFSTQKREQYEKTGDGDTAYTVGQIRIRLHLYHSGGKRVAALRLLPDIEKLPYDSDEELLARLASLTQGLILVAGPTGSGKSTTLARMIEEMNEKRDGHILTFEDPIEYLFTNKKALIHQREMGSDVSDFATGVRSALREDPDVIVIGEMRDQETLSAALTAAETGHLVIGTLHTGRAVDTVRRFVHAFLGERQGEVRNLLADVLKTVLVQELHRTGEETLLVREILMNTPAISHLIREGKEEQALSYMESGAEGMRTMETARRLLGLGER